jgi:hypothetical protein
LPRLVDGQLNGVVALSPTNVWAVGYTFPAGGATGPDHTLVEHFNGTSWTIVASPNPGNNSSNRFFSVTAISANDIWIGGATSSNKALNLTLAVQLANGSKFSVVNTPNPTGNNFESDLLFGATSDSSGNVWFGGTFEGKSSFDSLVLHASGG